MYEGDSLDRVIELHDSPRPDFGAPLPLVVGDDLHLVLAYLVSEPDPAWDGTYVTVVTPESQEALVALIRFQWSSAHMFGPPNDEAFSGHPLAARGLRPYGIYEIRDSSWIRRLERMNSVHPRHDRTRLLEHLRHFVFAFHDTTFECVARGFDSEVFRGSRRLALERIAAELATGWGS